MKIFMRAFLILLMISSLVFSPRMVQLALAQDNQESAPNEEIQTLQRLAKSGYLADKKDSYLSAKSLTDDDITDALLAINDQLLKLDLKSLKTGDKTYRLEDLQVLLTLVKDKEEDIRARKVSAWKFEKKIEKMIAILNPVNAEVPSATPGSAGGATMVETAPTPIPTSTATPIPGPNREEWDAMKGDIKDLLKKAKDFQDVYDKKIDALEKTNEDLKYADTEIKAANADNLEQLKLVKKLLDHVQDDLNKTSDRLDQVSQKASQKSITDTELQQELTIMHKDLRDNSQDVGILKQEVAKLDKTDAQAGQNPLDEVLTSKWLAGGALVVGLTALVVSLVRK